MTWPVVGKPSAVISVTTSRFPSASLLPRPGGGGGGSPGGGGGASGAWQVYVPRKPFAPTDSSLVNVSVIVLLPESKLVAGSVTISPVSVTSGVADPMWLIMRLS